MWTVIQIIQTKTKWQTNISILFQRLYINVEYGWKRLWSLLCLCADDDSLTRDLQATSAALHCDVQWSFFSDAIYHWHNGHMQEFRCVLKTLQTEKASDDRFFSDIRPQRAEQRNSSHKVSEVYHLWVVSLTCLWYRCLLPTKTRGSDKSPFVWWLLWGRARDNDGFHRWAAVSLWTAQRAAHRSDPERSAALKWHESAFLSAADLVFQGRLAENYWEKHLIAQYSIKLSGFSLVPDRLSIHVQIG